MSAEKIIGPRKSPSYYASKGDQIFKYIGKRLKNKDSMMVFREGYFDGISKLYGRKAPRKIFFALKLAEYAAKTSKDGFFQYLDSCLQYLKQGTSPEALYSNFAGVDERRGERRKRANIEAIRRSLEAKLIADNQLEELDPHHLNATLQYRENGSEEKHSPEMFDTLRKNSPEEGSDSLEAPNRRERSYTY